MILTYQAFNHKFHMKKRRENPTLSRISKADSYSENGEVFYLMKRG